MLISIGLIMLVRLNFNSAIKQFIIAAVSFVICGFIPFIMQKLKKIPNIPYVYAGIGIAALTFVFFLGTISGGSRLSVRLFGMYFMPSEFVKVFFVLFVAGALCIDSSFKKLIIITAIAALHIVILAGSNDLGVH